MSKQFELFMHRCLELASQGLGSVSPNPLVGAVLVKKDKIISEGFHEYFGGPHAEANCLLTLSDRSLALDGTLFVNLEPCTHFGKTPPCTDLIIACGIKKVVIGSLDTSELASGGVHALTKAGIEVTHSICKQESDFLNRRFYTRVQKKRPYLILKWAESADGCIAPADKSRFQLSGDASQKLLHQWRSEEAAIMVGSGTVISDNPKLTNRSGKGKNPVRVVIDRRKRISIDSNLEIFKPDARTILFGHPQMQSHQLRCSQTSSLKGIVEELSEIDQIDSLIIEGGKELLESFLEQNLWDEMRIFKTSKKLQNGLKAPVISSPSKTTEQIGEDFLVTYVNI